MLGLAIADMLYRAFPTAPEGELSRRLSELVRRETCAEVAVAWDVGPHLRLGAGEVHSGGRRNQAILADVCEAIIGAVFLDGGYGAAKDLVERSFGARLSAPRRPLRDPKSALQEWAQGRGLPTPNYSVVEQVGPDHAPRFQVDGRGRRGRARVWGPAVPSAPPNRTPRAASSFGRASGGRKPMASPDETATRAGFVALIGAPNAGKSTLLNTLVGSKVSIVSRKVQTTRALVRGIAIEQEAQIVFVDTPGIFKPKRRLDRAMVTSAWGGAGDADVVCLLVDARRGLDEEGEAILEQTCRSFASPKC